MGYSITILVFLFGHSQRWGLFSQNIDTEELRGLRRGKAKTSASRNLNPEATHFEIKTDQFPTHYYIRLSFSVTSDLTPERPTLHKSRMHTDTCYTCAETFDLPLF